MTAKNTEIKRKDKIKMKREKLTKKPGKLFSDIKLN